MGATYEPGASRRGAGSPLLPPRRLQPVALYLHRLDAFVTALDEGDGTRADGKPLNLLDDAFTDYMPAIRLT